MLDRSCSVFPWPLLESSSTPFTKTSVVVVAAWLDTVTATWAQPLVIVAPAGTPLSDGRKNTCPGASTQKWVAHGLGGGLNHSTRGPRLVRPRIQTAMVNCSALVKAEMAGMST